MKNKVETVANYLIQENGRTTTLEVKTELRTRGEQVYQSEVSKYMDELANECAFEYTFNGQFRVYTIDAQNSPVAIPPTTILSISKSKPSANMVVADWVVYSNLNDETFVAGKTTRGKARYAGAKVLNINYNQTRAKRYESN